MRSSSSVRRRADWFKFRKNTIFNAESQSTFFQFLNCWCLRHCPETGFEDPQSRRYNVYNVVGSAEESDEQPPMRLESE